MSQAFNRWIYAGILCLTLACATGPKKNTSSQGILLSGKPQALAISVVPKYLAKLSKKELLTEEPGQYKRILTALIAEKATVFQVNQVLQKTNVRIVASNPHSPVVSLLIPPPGGEQELQKIAGLLKNSGAFDTANSEYLSEEF